MQNFLATDFYVTSTDTVSVLGPPNEGWLATAGSALIGTSGAYNPIVWSASDSRAGGAATFQSISEGFAYSNVTTKIQFQVWASAGLGIYLGGTTVYEKWICCSAGDLTGNFTLGAGYTSLAIRFWGGPSMSLTVAFKLGGVGSFQTSGLGLFFSSTQRWYGGSCRLGFA